MNDSDSRAPSSTRLTDLKEILQQKEAEREAQAQATVNQAFRSFETNLSGSLSAVESTLRAGIAGLESALRSQQEALQRQVLSGTPRLLWFLRVPLLATMLLCLALIGVTLLWMPRELWNIRTSDARMMDGRTYLVIEDPQWTTCRMADGRERPCKTVEPLAATNPAPKTTPAAKRKPRPSED